MVVVASTVWRVVFSCQLLLFTICFFFFLVNVVTIC